MTARDLQQRQTLAANALAELVDGEDRPVTEWHIGGKAQADIEGELPLDSGTLAQRRAWMDRWAEILHATVVVGKPGTILEYLLIDAEHLGETVRIWTVNREIPPPREPTPPRPAISAGAVLRLAAVRLVDRDALAAIEAAAGHPGLARDAIDTLALYTGHLRDGNHDRLRDRLRLWQCRLTHERLVAALTTAADDADQTTGEQR